MRGDGLIPPRTLHRVAGLVDGGLVPVPNGSAARWARDDAGRLWVRKRERETTFDGLLAEVVGHLLGAVLEIPQPAAAVHVSLEDGWSWLSEAVKGVQHWEPSLRDMVVNVGELGRVLALDAIGFNPDRHPGNLLVQFEDDDGRGRVWAIDFGDALVGRPAELARRGLEVPRPHPDMRGLPVDLARQAALDGAVVASRLSSERLRVIVEEACAICEEPAADVLQTALARRCHHAVDIVARYLDVLGAAP